MKSFIAVILLALAAGCALLWDTFSAESLPVAEDYALRIPDARPPSQMRIAMLHAGKMESQAAFAWRGGAFGDKREFGMGGLLVQHPAGTLLFDAGFGRRVDAHVETIPLLMRLTSRYRKETTVAEQLAAAGIAPRALAGVVLTHAHWDHVSGIEDLPGVPVWVTQPELDFIRSGDPGTALARSFGELPYKLYEFAPAEYLGFDRSYDVFGDGSVVLVPAPGHTPGSIIAFVNTPDGKRLALVGDLVWQAEGLRIPAERPWISRRLVDHNEVQVRRWIVHMHQIQRALPKLIVVPAHDRRVTGTLPGLGA